MARGMTTHNSKTVDKLPHRDMEKRVTKSSERALAKCVRRAGQRLEGGSFTPKSRTCSHVVWAKMFRTFRREELERVEQGAPAHVKVRNIDQKTEEH